MYPYSIVSTPNWAKQKDQHFQSVKALTMSIFANSWAVAVWPYSQALRIPVNFLSSSVKKYAYAQSVQR